MVKAGKFKDDLFQRLNVIPILLPPLAERKEDIPLIISQMVLKQPSPVGTLKFTDQAMKTLQSYAWPGNVRELSNLISYLSTMVDEAIVDVADLPPKFRDLERKIAATSKDLNPTKDNSLSYYERVTEFEKRILTEEFERYQGNISQLALSLGMDRSHLYTKLKEFGIYSGRKNPNK
jgi:two-component system nitrogen regulation response regulator NtrX